MASNFLTKDEKREGCVRAFRRAWYNPVFKDFLEAAIWNWLFQNAQYEKGSHRINGQYVELDVGEVAFTISYLAKGFRVSEKVIRNVIKKIEKHGMGAIKSTNKLHIIKVLKYAEYQTYSLNENGEGQTKGQSKGNQRAIKGQSKGNNTKEFNEINEDNEIKEKNNADASKILIDGYEYEPDEMYADGKVIKLNAKDWSAWADRFDCLGDFKQILYEREKFLCNLPENDSRRKNWFFTTQKYFQSEKDKIEKI